MYEFEKHKKLTEFIQEIANTGKAPKEWTSFIETLNKSLDVQNNISVQTQKILQELINTLEQKIQDSAHGKGDTTRTGDYRIGLKHAVNEVYNILETENNANADKILIPQYIVDAYVQGALMENPSASEEDIIKMVANGNIYWNRNFSGLKNK